MTADQLEWPSPESHTPEECALRVAQARQSEADASRTVSMQKWMADRISGPEAWLRSKLMSSMSWWRGIDWGHEYDMDADDMDADTTKRQRAPSLAQAEAVGSKRDGVHVLALDIDSPAALLPSSTPGHWHLIIESYIEDADWRTLIEALAEAGIIERGYADASLARGETFLRLPWIRKGYEREDARAALEESLDEEPAL